MEVEMEVVVSLSELGAEVAKCLETENSVSSGAIIKGGMEVGAPVVSHERGNNVWRRSTT